MYFVKMTVDNFTTEKDNVDIILYRKLKTGIYDKWEPRVIHKQELFLLHTKNQSFSVDKCRIKKFKILPFDYRKGEFKISLHDSYLSAHLIHRPARIEPFLLLVENYRRGVYTNKIKFQIPFFVFLCKKIDKWDLFYQLYYSSPRFWKKTGAGRKNFFVRPPQHFFKTVLC